MFKELIDKILEDIGLEPILDSEQEEQSSDMTHTGEKVSVRVK